jgi:uncharacterized protein YndB with AHSA1/START domain
MINDGDVEHEALYPHPPERVWRALVDPAELAIWLMPNDFVAEVGHRFSLDASPTLGRIDGEVLEVDPPRVLRCRWSGVFGDTMVMFTLDPTPAGDGTRLRLKHAGWPEASSEQRDGFDGGWHDKLTKDLPELMKESS